MAEYNWNERYIITFPEEKTVLSTKDLHVYYGQKEAINGIDMQFEKNKITALIGPSGCGKSTFLRSLNRMNDTIDIARVTGQINYQGIDVNAQEINVYEMRTVTVYPEMESYYDLYRMRITYPDGTVVDSCQLSDEEVKNGTSYALFKFTEPLEIGINDDLAKDKYYNAALNLSINAIVQDNKEGLENFGLDQPISITWYNTSGDEKTMYLGNYVDEENEFRYGMMKDADCVVSVRGPFDFLTIDIYSLVDTTIWSHSINDVKTISIQAGDEQYEIYIDAYVNDDDSSDNRFYAEMDKTPLDEDSTRNTYVQLVSFPTLGYVKDFEMTDEELLVIQVSDPVFTMDITYDDGESCSVKLHTINDMQLAAEVDGNMLFYTSRSHMVKIIEYCAKLRSGEYIPEY